MSTITSPIILDETGKAIVEAIKALKTSTGNICYGMHIDGNESDPSAKVTYLRDAVGMTPAKMNFSTGVFSYGSWGNAFFIPRPCMLKTNGSVDYYLNPNDYTKKINGSSSDIANTSYDGNAMMEWGKDGRRIYTKIVPDENDSTSASIYIANYKEDDNFHDWCFKDKNGRDIPHFYTPCYEGSLDTSNKLRSLSGQTLMKSKTASQEMSYAKANGSDYNIEVFSDFQLISFLLILMGKSTDVQSLYGLGMSENSWDESLLLKSGTMNTKGLFWGENTGKKGVKVFGMENIYGNQWRRILGLILDHSMIKYKLTESTIDGSTVTSYNIDGSGYISVSDSAPVGTSGGYIKFMKFTVDGMFPKEASGSSNTYFPDAYWFNINQINLACCEGGLDNSRRVGLCVALSNTPSLAAWGIGAGLSCKPSK